MSTVEELRAQLAEAEAAEAAAALVPADPEPEPEPAPEAEPAAEEPAAEPAPEAEPAPVVSGGVSSDVRAALNNLHRRLLAVEAHLGL